MPEPSWLSEQPGTAHLPIWSRFVVGEMLPEVASPLGWTVLWEPCATLGWRDALIHRFGFDETEISVDAPETIRGRGGHAYVNASTLKVLAHRSPQLHEGHIDRLLGGELGPVPVHRHEEWHDPDPVTAAMLDQWYRWVLESRNQVELENLGETVDETLDVPLDLASMSDTELMNAAIALQPLARSLFDQQLNQLLATTVGPTLINEFCNSVGQPAHALRLLSGIGRVEPVSPTLALWELSRLVRSSPGLRSLFDQGLDRLDKTLRLSNQTEAKALIAGVNALVAEVGHRGPNEWDLASPTWDEAHDIVLALIRCMYHCDDSLAPQLRRRHLEADRQRLVAEIAEALPEERRPVFRSAVASSAVFLRGRETCRDHLMRVVHRMRRLIGELGVRGERRGDFGSADEIWMLTAEEAEYYADGGLADTRHLTALRQAEYDVVRSRELPNVIDDTGNDNRAAIGLRQGYGTPMSADLEPGDIILGSPGSPGMASGKARVIETDADLAEVRPGEIIVLDQPSLVATALFVAAGAVITDIGGPFTHAVVVARELGTPMVVGAAGASHRITTGMMINVDGLTGVVSCEEVLADEVRVPSPNVA